MQTILQETTGHVEYARRYQHVMSVINAEGLAIAMVLLAALIFFIN